MPRDLILQLFAHLSAALVSGSLKHDEGKGIHSFLIDQDIEFYKL